MNKDIVIHVQLTVEDARRLDNKIVSNTQGLKSDILEMYYGNGHKAIGFETWGEYLDSVSERAGIGTKALRRLNKASLLMDGVGISIDTFKEGTVRPIVDTLSDRKGFNEVSRGEALELAIELAGDINNVTANVSQTAAWYVEVSERAPNNGQAIVQRMRSGDVSTKAAHQLTCMMLNDDAEGMEHIIAELSDVDLAKFLINLKEHGPEAWEDIQETVERTGHMPVRDGQVPVGLATYTGTVDYLDEPYRMVRYEKAVERSAALKELAKIAARLATEYWGIHQAVPESIENRKTESELYQLLLDLGFIKYGAN